MINKIRIHFCPWKASNYALCISSPRTGVRGYYYISWLSLLSNCCGFYDYWVII